MNTISPKRLSPEDDAEALALHVQGVSDRKIAERLGISAPTVKKAVQRATSRLTRTRSDADIEDLRSQSLESYDRMAELFWERLRQTPLDSPASSGLANVLVKIQERKDRLLGLETIRIDHRVAAWTRLQQVWADPVTLVPEVAALEDKSA